MLRNLLNRNLTFSPVYPSDAGNLSNHLSMVLIALNKLGASDAQLICFNDYYQERLIDKSDPVNDCIMNDDNWQVYLGQNRYYVNYFSYFQKKIDKIGRAKTIQTVIDTLVKGIEELHGLIRLAYAIEDNNDMEIAAALAYFSAYYKTNYKYNKSGESYQSVMQGLMAINNNQNFRNLGITGRNINERLKKIIQLPNFITIHRIDVNEKTLPQLANAMLYLFIMTKDFLVLHAITTIHAMRVIMPYVTNKSDCLNYLWYLITSIYIYVGAPSIIDNLKNIKTSLNWQSIISKALNSKDAHIIKFLYSCQEENKAYQSPLYLYAAEL